MSELLRRKYQREPADVAHRRMAMTDAARSARRFVATHGVDFSDGFQQLTPDELLLLGINVIQSRNVQEAYRNLAATSSRGLCYYDEIIGIQHIEGYLGLYSALLQKEPGMVDIGVDIGAGSGESALVLSSHANFTIALDAMPELLPIAEKKLTDAGVNHKIVVADITNLSNEIPPDSVDIVTNSALAAYLNTAEREEAYKAVNRILKRGGRYYEYRFDDPQVKVSRYETSPRGRLVQQIAREVLSFTFVPERKTMHPTHPPEDFGFVGEEIGFYNGPSALRVIRLIKI